MFASIKKLFGILFLIGILFLFISSFISAYTNSNPNYGLFEKYSQINEPVLDRSVCTAGQDFLIQVAPFGCTPAVIRSDLLEEQNVPVFCQLSATKINPLIDVEAIDSVSFTGKYPKEISGVGFHPARAALGVTNKINSPLLNNIGYVVVVLKKQQNESGMPDYVAGNLTAKIKYDIKNAFGIGAANFYLSELSDAEWQEEMGRYGFWNKKGFLRANSISSDGAVISLSDGFRQISSLNLKKGETSQKISLPGFDCLATLQLRLDALENPDTRAKLRVNENYLELVRGEKFLENRCVVRDVQKQGIVQKTTISCNEDTETKTFNLMISPKIRLSIDDVEKEVGVGDKLFNSADNTKAVYVGYIGTAGDAGNLKNLYVRLVATPQFKDRLSDEEIASVTSIDNYLNTQKGTLLKDLNAIGNAYIAGTIKLGKQVIEGKNYDVLPYATGANDGFKTIFGKQLKLIGFSGTTDVKDYDETTSDAKLFADYFDRAKKDYDTIQSSFAGEKESEASPVFGERSLAEEINLLYRINQKRTMAELCREFKEKYPQSGAIPKECEDEVKFANSEVSDKDVLINGKYVRISFDGIYDPTWEDYGAEIVMRGSDGTVRSFLLVKNQIEYLDNSNTEYIQLLSLDENAARVNINLHTKGTSDAVKSYVLSDTKILSKGMSDSFGSSYIFTLTRINLKKVAKVSVLPGINNAGTEANFSFIVGIEKRAIKLSPEKTKEKIESLDKTIKDWEDKSEKLGNVVQGFKGACLGVGATLTVKNFFANTGGKAIARQNVMRNNGGWNEKCSKFVSDGVYATREQCMVEKADNIDADVEAYYKTMEGQNNEIKVLQEGITETTFFGEKKINDDEFKKKFLSDNYKNELKTNLKGKFGSTIKIGAEDVSIDSFVNNLRVELTSVEELRSLQFYSRLGGDLDSSSQAELKKIISSIHVRNQNQVQQLDYSAQLKQAGGLDNIGEVRVYQNKDSIEAIYDGGKTTSQVGEISLGSNVQAIIYENTNYIVTLDKASGNQYFVTGVYTSGGVNLEVKGGDDTANRIKRTFVFKGYDQSSYHNKYTNAQLRYYETEPYKGLPALVPFDLNNGWYASVKQTLPILGNIRSYDESGRISSFYLCNVGINGKEEDKGGDDICQLINLGTGQPYNQFPGLSTSDASKIVQNAVKAVEQASKLYKPGLSGKVRILNDMVDIGSPAVNVPEMQCQDFMSPKDCQLLFNVCDPVICPSSRCDFGGSYPVKDVVQSGIVGSIALCLPNFREGIYVPVCLTGIKAGIDGLLSVFTSYRDCLQDSLNTGKMVGVCDEIYSIYLCDFFWRQALPLTKVIVPKVVEIALGQNVHGGGEYLGVASAWETAGKSADFFVQYYASNSYDAFKTKVAEKVQATACKSFLSVSYPEGGNLLDTLTEPDSPPQFHARFDEISFTTATVPPVSQYKVYYHIYAGKNSRAVYKVYLKGATEGSFYQDLSSMRIVDSGYIAVGDTVDQTRDFTAPSGYKQLCVMVNNQEECGFGSISTDFAVNYVKDKYAQSQAEETSVKSEKECVAGSMSVYSLLSPNLQAGAQEIVSPDLYNQGIIRICSSDNPGKGTDAYSGTANARWKEVGNCGDAKIKCWVDTQSVKNVVKNKDIENATLSVLTDNSLKILADEGKYVDASKFPDEVKKINSAKTNEEKVILVNAIYDKVFFNHQKAQLLLLRGNAYGSLAISMFNKLPKVDRTIVSSETNFGGVQLSTDKRLLIQGIIDGTYSVPDYPYTKQGQYCAKYAKDTAKELFGLEYHSTDAWCREKAGDILVKKFDSADIKNNQEVRNILQPGMIVATRPLNCLGEISAGYCGTTQTCRFFDDTKVEYSHNLLYLGLDKTNEPVFIESYSHTGPTKIKLSQFGNARIVMAVFKAPPSIGLTGNIGYSDNTPNTTVVEGEVSTQKSPVTIDGAIAYLKANPDASYSDGNLKVIIDELCNNGNISETDCINIKGIGIFNLEENSNSILNILQGKLGRIAWNTQTALKQIDKYIQQYGEVTYTGNLDVEKFVNELKTDNVLKDSDLGVYFSPWDLGNLRKILEIKLRPQWNVNTALVEVDRLLKENAPSDATEKFRLELITDKVLEEEDFDFTGKNLESIKTILLQKRLASQKTNP
jgi:hypothetical protein